MFQVEGRVQFGCFVCQSLKAAKLVAQARLEPFSQRCLSLRDVCMHAGHRGLVIGVHHDLLSALRCSGGYFLLVVVCSDLLQQRAGLFHH